MSGEKHPLFGKIHSEETRKKMSEAMSGKTYSEETRKKMSEAKLGKKNHFFGKSLSEETKEKLSKSQGTIIFLYSLNDLLICSFTSSRAAAKHFNCGHHTIMKYARSHEIFKDQYRLSLVALSE